MNRYDLKGKVALITGSGQGIGKGAAQAIAQSGGNVILCGRTMNKLNKVAKELELLGVEVMPIEMDISSIDEINDAVSLSVEKFGQIDILLNCAGISDLFKLVDIEPEFWDEIFDINLRGSVFMSKAVAKHMIEKEIHGTIEFVSSQAGKIGEYGNAAYSASKSALHALCQSMALELAEYNINVVTVCPGFTNTQMMQTEFQEKGVLNDTDPKIYEQELIDTIPLKRMASPYEVGSLMAYLSSGEASYITGVTITMAGGYVNI
ncbi:SDR family NAD(P)-dependent oxidoreductase [Priestia megaterium]|uniref:SDR family NAD(P)-dependent oxidoreductase n=1 Tax=Priestia megaterium TaxID=1404 RepID=UPI0021BE22DF|nr:SDR family oxidoreductase [Priestia megaterium]MCT9855773.1 SDR family oxidoreductase [Priestia megaterium]MDF1962980.1 SDR family NAD(P)-dependent oxidoreductase [Priestia megaterium]